MSEDADDAEPRTDAVRDEDEPGTDETEPRAESSASPQGTESPPRDDVRGVTLDDEDDLFGSAYGVRRRPDRNPEEFITRPGRSRSALRNISRADLREHYGPLRTLFKQRESAYSSFQHQLIQAWVRQTYDQYLATVVGRALTIALVGIALSLLAGAGLLGAQAAGAVPDPLGQLGMPVETLAAVVVGAGAVAAVGAGFCYWAWWRVLWIRHRITTRRREIDYTLPFAVTFMYALARADVGFDRIIARLADSTETYGAVGQEFDRVAREMEMFGNNLYIGLENLRSVTPSEELRRLVDDLLTVLETGGDLAAFLRDEVDTQLETAVAEQERFIEQLELLGEVFVVGFVAAPLFVLVVLIVISFLGAETLGIVGVLVYAAIPLSLAAFVVLVDVIGEPFQAQPVTFTPTRDAPTETPSGSDAPDWWARYERDKRHAGVRNRLRDQIAQVRDQPWRALLFSAPIALALPVAAVLTGAVPFGLTPMLENPVDVTTDLVVWPLVVAATPVAVVYEYRQRKELAFERRFPDLLELLATSNRRGLSLTRGLGIISETTSGRLGDELRLLRNDIRWNADLPDAFEAFGNRLSSATLTRTVTLIAEGSRATSDLHVVLEVAATDTAERVRLERERRQTLQSYLVIVVIGFLVYLLVVLLLAANFLDPIEAFSAGSAAAEGPVTLGAVPVRELRTVLFHSALIQGFGSGMLAGKLAENSLYSGLKYGIGLLLVAVVAFTVV